LDYEVQLTPLATVDGLTVFQRKAVVRYDTQEVIGVVGNNYVPVQNRQCFGFLDAVVAEGASAITPPEPWVRANASGS
jgi:hypothetical protein